MFVRRVRTASGAVAVQVVAKVRGRVEVVEHVSSARTDAELGVLIEYARGVVAAGQQQLELGVEAVVPVERMDDVADWRSGRLPVTAEPAAVQVAVTGRTVATGSHLLYQALGSVFDRLGFGVVTDRVFRDLVIARIVRSGRDRAGDRKHREATSAAPQRHDHHQRRHPDIPARDPGHSSGDPRPDPPGRTGTLKQSS
ncbi:hypothetical protein ABIA39_008678 [Nocardia sp. GAS34]|uniref:hypothetical protein n=1 Tax=unclassified Nocardia TaxID=2637762 RepID=UPI003D1FBACA